MGKIVHGNENFGYAPILTDEYGNMSFGNPTMLPGMVSSSMEVTENQTTIYGDDVSYCVVNGAKARTLDIVLRYIPSAYAEYLGFHINANGMITDTGTYPNHCVFFEQVEEDCATGSVTKTLWYVYNVKGSEPSRETQTDEEEISAQELTVSYTSTNSAFVQDDQNVFVQVGYVTRTDANANAYDSFKTQVLLPTSVLVSA